MKRILIVEDDADIRDLIRMTLEMESYDIHEAVDGDSGLQQALAWQPHLILLDVMMPGRLNGLAVCEQVRRSPPLSRTKVVILSARSHATDRQAGLQAGADAYLVKPFSPRELLDVIHRMI